MKVREEIALSVETDVPVLLWLFERYHWASQWGFVAKSIRTRYGTNSYEVHRTWEPTLEGRAIYTQLSGDKS